jgi:hypothetical protein
MRALYRHNGKQINSVAAFSDLHSGSETGKTTTDDRDFQTVTCH